MVDTSVAVATPSTTVRRMTNGSANAGNEMMKARRLGQRRAANPRHVLLRQRRRMTMHNAAAGTRLGNNPPVNNVPIAVGRERSVRSDDHALFGQEDLGLIDQSDHVVAHIDASLVEAVHHQIPHVLNRVDRLR